jgi:3-hydroxyisobutyrate dehydrogenase-like beta-hydroxyacid dehydrogenase
MARLERVAFLGLGIMGSRMAANLCRAGFDVAVWNRTRSKADAFAAEHEARVAATPADAACAAEAVITMVVDFPQVEAVLFGDDGAAEGMAEESLAIDMSTIAPDASRAIAARLAERGVGFLDAPVSGSSPKAEDGTLTIMVGGEAADFERAKPLFEAMGELVVHVGPQGDGSTIKLINNTVAAEGDFEPLFKLAHMLKDVRHTLSEAERLRARMEVSTAAERLYEEAAAQDLGDRDFAAVFRVVTGGSSSPD